MNKTTDLSYFEVDTALTGVKQSRHILKGLMEGIFLKPAMKNKTHTVYKKGSGGKGEATHTQTQVPQWPQHNFEICLEILPRLETFINLFLFYFN